MTQHIDGERLRSYLEDQLRSLSQSAKERHAVDGPDDPTALRMDGGVANMHLILTVLDNFEISRVRKPVGESSTPVATKVRRKDPGTSWEAATLQSAEKSKRLYEAIYRLLRSVGPLTDDELRAEMRKRNFDYHAAESVTKRRGELRDAGWVRATDRRRPSDEGVPMTVWEAVL